MSGRTASILLALCLPATLSATCNPKKTQPGGADDPPVEPAPASGQPATSAEVEAEGVKACPGLEAAAGPLGPAVGPSCPGGGADVEKELAGGLEALAAVHAGGLAPLGPAARARVTDGPELLRSAVLQGPPHCYVLVAGCDEDRPARLAITAAGTTTPLVEAEGPVLRFCPSATGSFDVSVAVEEPPLTCAARLYGD